MNMMESCSSLTESFVFGDIMASCRVDGMLSKENVTCCLHNLRAEGLLTLWLCLLFIISLLMEHGSVTTHSEEVLRVSG